MLRAGLGPLPHRHVGEVGTWREEAADRSSCSVDFGLAARFFVSRRGTLLTSLRVHGAVVAVLAIKVGDAAVFWAGVAGGQDHVYAVCFELLLSTFYQRPRRAPRCVLLEAVLAGAASGVAIARSVDRRRDGGSSRAAQPVLDFSNNQDGQEDALSEAEEG